MAWAGMRARPPTDIEQSVIQSLLSDGATPDLFQDVIERIAERDTYIPPRTLKYFESAIRDELELDELEAPVGKRLCPHWKPSPEGVEFARNLGYSAEDQAAAFRRHHLRTGKLMVDWDACFELWCLRRHGWDRLDGMPPGGRSRSGDDQAFIDLRLPESERAGGAPVINAATEQQETNSVLAEAAKTAEPIAVALPQPVATVPSPPVANALSAALSPYGRIVALLANRGSSRHPLSPENADILPSKKEDILPPDSTETQETKKQRV
jgi:hypothetical protein